MPNRTHTARIVEIGQVAGSRTAWIDGPREAAPPPGRYVLAWSPEEPDAPLATALFACTYAGYGMEGRFQAAAPTPHSWEPGMALILRGPLGRGFSPPPNLRRLALAALDVHVTRLLPLLYNALQQGAAVALFTGEQVPLPALPAAVEISPLEALPEALTWADYLAADLPRMAQPNLRACLGLDPAAARLPCPAQALVYTELPCGGLAECGVCSVPTRSGLKLACEAGPVFDVNELLAVSS